MTDGRMNRQTMNKVITKYYCSAGDTNNQVTKNDYSNITIFVLICVHSNSETFVIHHHFFPI